MQKEILSNGDELYDLRQMFMEADEDYSGFLTVDELQKCLTNLGANVSLEEVEKLLTEVDFDKDAKLDINEFIALMKLGNNAKKMWVVCHESLPRRVMG